MLEAATKSEFAKPSTVAAAIVGLFDFGRTCKCL
jgi:hypothetical protein